MSDERKRGKVYLAVHKDEAIAGNLMYILIDDRSLFDVIDLPEGGNARVRHKSLLDDHTKQHIIFQFWIKELETIDLAFRCMAYSLKQLAAAQVGA